MDDDKNIEVVEPVEEQVLEEVQPEEAQEPQKVVQSEVEDSKTMNMRLLREKAEREAERAIAAEKRAAEMEAYIRQQQQQVQKPSEEPDDNDITEYKHLKAVKKDAQEAKEETKQLKAMLTQLQIQNKYPDFSEVVTPKAVEALKLHAPALTETLYNTKDHYAQMAGTYEAIKNLGLEQSPAIEAQKEKVQRNLAKPRPGSSAVQSPLASATLYADGPLTDTRKRDIWANMQQILQNKE